MTRDIIYAAYEYFITEFVKDWTVRTENPHEANLFFIPALVRARLVSRDGQCVDEAPLSQ